MVPSVFLKDEARRLFSLPERLTVEVMPNFVDTDRFAPRATRDTALLEQLFGGGNEHWGPLLFHVSTFRPVKRVVDVIEVLERVRRKIPARLVLVGDGPERARVETRVRALGLEGVVRFLGERRDFVSYLQQADAFLLPSETESFGVAALEALSAGVPVFGYDVGGLPELVTQDLTSCKNFEICRIGSVAAIIYGFKLCFSAFLLSGGQASEYPHLASCSSRAQLRSQF